MIRNIINKFGTVLYVQIWENRIKVIDIETSLVFDEKPYLELSEINNGKRNVIAFGNKANKDSLNPFSHPRVLFSDFEVAERLLQLIIKKLLGENLFFKPAPAIIIHPMEKLEGGVTMIEVRAFKELAYGAGARDAFVYHGQVLEASTINYNKLAKSHRNQ